MPEVTIKYQKPETLKILKGLAEYFDFEIKPFSSNEKMLDDILVSEDQKIPKEYSINGVTIISGDPSIDITELREVFTGKNLDAKKLREEAWRRPK